MSTRNLLGWLPGMTGLIKILANSVEAPEARQAINLIGATAEDDPFNEATTLYVDRSLHGKPVNAAAPSDGQALLYDAGAGAWVPGLVSGTASLVTLVGNGSGAGGRFEIGDIVCGASDTNKEKVKLATGANLVAGDVRGALLATGYAGDTVQLADVGAVVTPGTLGVSSAPQRDYLVLNATTGRVFRKAYPVPGDVIVGTCELNGNSRIAGGALHLRKRHLLEFIPPGASVSSITDWITYLEAGDAALVPGQELEVSWIGDIPISRKYKALWDDSDHGNKKSNRIRFEQGNTIGGGPNQIIANFSNIYGKTASIVGVGNGSGSATFTATASSDQIAFTPGPGNFAKVRFTTTVTLPGGLVAGTDYWLVQVSAGVCKVATSLANAVAGTTIDITSAGSGTHTLTVQASGQTMLHMTGCTGVTLALAAELEGEPCWVWNSTPQANNTRGIVCKVPADGEMYVYCGTAGIATDNSGAVHFEIFRSVVDVRSAGAILDHVAVQPGAGQTVGDLIHVGEAPGPGSAVQGAFRGESLFCYSSQPNTRRALHGFAFARSIVPKPGNTHFSTNGDGIPEVYNPGNVSEGIVDNLKITGLITAAGSIGGYGANGQAEQWKFRHLTVSNCRGIWLNPHTGNPASAYYQAHADFEDVLVGNNFDTLFASASTARPTVIRDVRGETFGTRLYERLDGVNANAVTINGVFLSLYGTAAQKEHPSRELITNSVKGKGVFRDININFGTDTSGYLLLKQNANSKAKISGSVIGNTARTGLPATLTAANRGPIVYADGDTLTLLSAAGVDQTKAITKAAVEAAMQARGVGTYTADRDKGHFYELAAWITDNFTGIIAYGRADDSGLTLYSTAFGASAYLKVGTAAGNDPGTLGAKLGFSTTPVAGVAQTKAGAETGGWLELSAGVSSTLLSFDVQGIGIATNTAYPLPSFESRFYGTTTKIVGDRYPYYFEITHTGGSGTTITATFGSLSPIRNDQVDLNYTAEPVAVASSAGAATGSNVVRTRTKSLDKFEWTVAADPGAGQSVTWGVTVRRGD